MARPGTFVTLEGIDGSGKSTNAALLADALASCGVEVVRLRDPGGTELSERIRSLLLDPASAGMCVECELLLYEAARAQLVREAIMPALGRGAVVICDRYLDSTLAYQSAARGLPAGLVARANALGGCGVMPDRTIVLDIEASVAHGRIAREGVDRMEAEGAGFQDRVRDGYLRLAGQEPRRVRVVDARGPLEVVFGRLVDALVDLLPALAGGASIGRGGVGPGTPRGTGDADGHAPARPQGRHLDDGASHV